MYKIILTFCFFTFSQSLQSQINGDAPKVFLDCQSYRCDMNFIKSEMPYLNYMLDRQTADVYIMITSLGTGAGGREVHLNFKGKHRFQDIDDTIVYYTNPDISDLEIRKSLVNHLKSGLLPYVVKTSLARRIDYKIEKEFVDNTPVEISTIEDPWDFWIFRIGGNGRINGEESYHSFSWSSNFHAGRVTDDNKFQFSSYLSYNESNYDFEEGPYTSISRYWGGSVAYVKSISSNWSLGGLGQIYNSSFSNMELSVTLSPGIEYNLYPYAEASKRQLTFFYRIGPRFNNYNELTVYGKNEEWLVRQSLDIGWKQIEDWGTVIVELETGSFLHDLNLLNVSFNPELEWNIFRGLNLGLGARFSLVRDQISLPSEEVTGEEVLLRNKQLKTNYAYRGFVGISYRFGSSVSNVVNLRFNDI